MVERTEIEKRVRRLIAGDVQYRVLKLLGERGIRRLTNKAKEIVDLLSEKEEIGSRVFARIEEKDEEKARTLREGISEFNKEYPSYGKILEGIIAKKRLKKNENLIYGLEKGYKLNEQDYVQVMMDLGFEKREASSLYPHILAISTRLEREDEQTERTILISKS